MKTHDKELYEAVGKRIREVRKERGMTIAQLAKQIGKSENTVRRYEYGESSRLFVNILQKISIALDVSPLYLMGYTEDKTMPEIE